MSLAPHKILPNDPDLLPAVREFLARHPSYKQRGVSEIAEDIFCLRYMSYRPHEAAVEAALEPLAVEGDILP